MRKKNVIAAILVSGIMAGGAGIAMGGESAPQSSPVQVLSDDGTGDGTRAAGTAVSTVAQATDAVIRGMGDGRVTAVALSESGGRTVWTVTIDLGKGPVEVTLDAATGEILATAAPSADVCPPGTGTGTGSDDDDDDDDGDDDDDDDGGDDDDGDDDDDDDDGGPVREGAEPNK